MGTALVFRRPRQIEFATEEETALARDEVRLRTLFSGISAGTELTAYRGTNPYLHKRWDNERRLFVADDRLGPAYPVQGWGYEECGEIVELGDDAKELSLGQRVYGTWGHRGKPVTASSYESADFVPSGAVDDNNGTQWFATDGSKPQWLQVDLGANYSVSKTMLAFEHVVLWTKYKIEYSTNGTTWSTFVDRTNVTTGKGLITDTRSPVTARYFRVTVTATEDSDHWAAIWEFKIFQ